MCGTRKFRCGAKKNCSRTKLVPHLIGNPLHAPAFDLFLTKLILPSCLGFLCMLATKQMYLLNASKGRNLGWPALCQQMTSNVRKQFSPVFRRTGRTLAVQRRQSFQKVSRNIVATTAFLFVCD